MVGRLLPILALLACADAPAGIRVADARAPAPADPALAAAYFTLINDGPADTLASVSVAGAEHATLHESVVADGRRSMRAVPRLALPTGSAVRLVPGGLHVMIEGLDRRPMAGDTLTLTVRFRRHAPIAVAVPVVRYEDLEP